jgi:hypothetical protein
MSLRWRCGVAPTSGRCRADVAAMALRRRSDVGPMSGRCRCDGAATSLRRRADVGPMSLRWRCDVLRRRCDVAAMALRRRSAAKYAHAHSHKDVYGPRLARKEAADGGAWDQFKEGYPWTRQNVSVKYHQLVGDYRCCALYIANYFCAVGPSL